MITYSNKSVKFLLRNRGTVLVGYCKIIHSDKGLMLKMSVLETIYGSQITSSTQLIKPEYLILSILKLSLLELKKVDTNRKYFPNYDNNKKILPGG